MTFWRTDASGRWVKDGQVASIPGLSPDASTSIDGKLLPGASHAVFILHRDIGGTGGAPRTQVFAKSSAGWGAVVVDDKGTLKVSPHRSIEDFEGAFTEAKFENNLLKLGQFETRTYTADGWIAWQGYRLSGESFARVGGLERPANAVDYGVMTLAVFTDPTGDVTCRIANGRAVCYMNTEVLRQTLGDAAFSRDSIALDEDGAGPAIFDVDGVQMRSDEAGEWARTGEPVPPREPEGVYVLPHGKSLGGHGVKCTTSVRGVTCSNNVASFTVSNERLELTGKRAQ